MSKKLSIKDIKSPDKFFKSMLSFVGYLRHNVKLYLVLSGVVVVITTAVVLVNYIHDSKEEKARNEFYNITKQIQMLNTDDTASAIKIIEGDIGKLGKTGAGMEATYMLGELYYSKKDWDAAGKYYEKASSNGEGLVKELAMLGLAYTKENKNDIKGALETFNKLKDLKASAYAAIAALGAGRCYQRLGDKANALASYEAIIIAYPDTDYARQASTAKAAL
jgi:predicted negative regulator of RcsB-dependent stress response